MPLVDPVVVSDEVTTVVVAETQDIPEAPSKAEEQGVPDKFRGKSAAEIAQAYANLESELGRARNEIGTNRRLVDELLNLRRDPPAKSEPARQPVTPYDLTENPEEAITRVAKQVADERTAGAEERLAQLENSLAAQDFEKRHPGWRNLGNDQEFVEWARGSNTRIRLAQRAAQNDWDSGDELLNLWNEHKALKGSSSPKPDPKDAAKAAGLAKSGGSGANKVVSSGDGKKIYSRVELARLYANNPEEYDRLMDSGELRQAYAEKRVR